MFDVFDSSSCALQGEYPASECRVHYRSFDHPFFQPLTLCVAYLARLGNNLWKVRLSLYMDRDLGKPAVVDAYAVAFHMTSPYQA